MDESLKNLLPNGKFPTVDPGRSRIMSAVRGKSNRTTERRLRAALIQAGIRDWQLHPKNLPGKPDFVFRTRSLVVFVDGCFWHGCPMCGHAPKKNSQFWKAKLQRTRERDLATAQDLNALGFVVLRFWEHQLQTELTACVAALRDHLGQVVGSP